MLTQRTRDPHALRDLLADHYVESTGAHYVIGQEAEIIQVASDLEVAWGVGMGDQIGRETRWERWLVDEGHTDTAERWRERWAHVDGIERPSDLVGWHGVRHRDANRVYIHVEVTPQLSASGIWFTPAQHDAVAALAADLAVRHGWAEEPEWWRSPRLVGHEDLSSTRWHPRIGGWDPGALAASPRWEWGRVYETLRAAS